MSFPKSADKKDELKVPNVVGMRSGDAYSKLSGLGLQYSTDFDYSDSVPEDYVISQTPSQDQPAKAGDTVSLTISRGTKPKEEKKTTPAPAYKDTQDFYGLQASSRYLTTSDISWMSLTQIQFAINELYAKHGFRFTKGDDKYYFESMDWYNPDTSDMNVIAGRMNEYEKANLKVMGAYRNALK